MPENQQHNYSEITTLLTGVYKPLTLKEFFDKKLQELKIAPTNVLDILDIQYRTLHGILDGTQKTVDYINLVKLANFLQLPKEQVINLHLEALEKNYPTSSLSPEKIKFIRENFDLAVLKQAGFIRNIMDFNEIEQRIIARLNLKSIFDYRKPPVDQTFCTGLQKPKNSLTRSFWIHAAASCFEEICNPYEYDRQALINFFPKIRWHSMDSERGLLEIVKALYKMGITIIYQPPLQTMQVRGATFSVNYKPGIALSNYQGFYATLWLALIHELYHVLFDWEEIKTNHYHVTDEANDLAAVREREQMADQFARAYLLSKEKTESVKQHINDNDFVRHFANGHYIHPGMVYVFNAFDVGKNDRVAWARAKRESPDARVAISAIEISWQEKKPLPEVLYQRKLVLYE